MFAVKSRRAALAALEACAGAVLLAGMLHTGPAHAWGFSWNKDAVVVGSGNVVSSTRAVTGFQGIEVSVPGTIKIVQGEAEGLVIRTDDNIAPFIETEVERGSLRIRFANSSTSVQTKQLDITVFVKTIHAVSLSGSGTIRSDRLQGERLKISVGGSGDVALSALDLGSLDVSIGGSGTVQGDGQADALSASIAGSSTVRLGQLKARSARVSIAGSGDVQVWATENIKASIAGSGDLAYFGNAVVSSSIAGSGTIKRLGDAPTPTKP